MLQSNPKYADVPVIMLSSKDGLFIAPARFGSAEYLTKPFSKRTCSSSSSTRESQRERLKARKAQQVMCAALHAR